MRRFIICVVFFYNLLFVLTRTLAQPIESLENIMDPLYPSDPVLEQEVVEKRGEIGKQLLMKALDSSAKKDYDKSIAYCKEVLAINPDDYEANVIIGESYARKGDFKKAVAYYQKATNVYPSRKIEISFTAFFSPDDSTYEKNFYKAIEDYKKEIANNPNDYQAYNDLGYLSSILGVDPGVYYKKSIAIKPDYIQAHYNLGIYYLIYKDEKLALEECEILERLNKDLAKVILRTVNLLAEKRKKQKS